MNHCFEQAIFVVFIRVALEMQQQASVSRFSVHLCFNLCSVLDYFHADKGNLAINRKLHRKRQAGVEAIKGSQKINCSISSRHSGQGIINRVSPIDVLASFEKAYWKIEPLLEDPDKKELASSTLRSIALNYIQRASPNPPKALVKALNRLKKHYYKT